jgi:hypothetical protein
MLFLVRIHACMRSSTTLAGSRELASPEGFRTNFVAALPLMGDIWGPDPDDPPPLTNPSLANC